MVACGESENLLAANWDVGVRDTVITVANWRRGIGSALVGEDDGIVVMVGVGNGHLSSPSNLEARLCVGIGCRCRGDIQSTSNTGGKVLGQERAKNVGSWLRLRSTCNLRSGGGCHKGDGLIVHCEMDCDVRTLGDRYKYAVGADNTTFI